MAYFMLKRSGDEPVRYEVPKTLTYGEQIDVFQELGDQAAALGVVWIAVRRQFPGTTVKDLRECEIEMFEDEEDALPPTNGAGGVSVAASEKPMEAESTGSPG